MNPEEQESLAELLTAAAGMEGGRSGRTSPAKQASAFSLMNCAR